MKLGRPVEVAVLAAAVVLSPGLWGCAGLLAAVGGKKKPKVTVNDVKLRRASLQGIDLELNCTVENPYSVSLPAVALKYRVWIADVDLAEGKVQFDKSVPAKGSAPVTTVLSFGPVNAVRVVGRLAGGNRKYRVAGTLTVRAPFGEIGIEVEKSGTLKGGSIPGARIPFVGKIF